MLPTADPIAALLDSAWASRTLRALGLGLLPAFILGACGTSTDEPRSGPGADDAEFAATATETQARADALLEAIAGDELEREAAHFLEFKQLNRTFDECMATEGFKVPSGFLPIWTGYRANGTSGAWMGALGRAPSIAALATAESIRAGEGGDEFGAAVEKDAYQRAVGRCSVDEPVVDLGARPGVPEGADDLGVRFTALIEQVDAQLGSLDPYRECMSKAGFGLPADGAQGWQGLHLYLTGQMPLPPVPGEEASRAWSSYLELEAAALDSDERCRSTKYQEGLALLEPLLDEFVSVYAEEIARIEAGWERSVLAARTSGFGAGG